MVGGFAGSVKNGFILIDEIRHFLNSRDPMKFWDPEEAVEKWSRFAAMIYENHPEYDKDTETHLLISGVHPTKSSAPPEVPRTPKALGAILRSPDFHPEFYFRDADFYNIGSGKDVEEYRVYLEKLNWDFPKLYEMEEYGFSGYAVILEGLLKRKIAEYPTPGVSRHLHSSIISEKYYSGQILQHSTRHADGSRTEHPNPTLATSWLEFLRMLDARRIGGAESALC